MADTRRRWAPAADIENPVSLAPPGRQTIKIAKFRTLSSQIGDSEVNGSVQHLRSVYFLISTSVQHLVYTGNLLLGDQHN